MTERGVRLSNVSTDGSLDNLQRLVTGRAEIALAQQDTVSEYLEPRTDTPILVSDRLFFECLHILVRASLNVRTARDFRGMTVWAGQRRSGTRRTAMRLLDSVGLTKSHVVLRDGEIGVEDLTGLFRDRSIDVAMIVAAPGSPTLKRGLATGAYSTFALKPDTVRILTSPEAQQRFRGQLLIGAVPPDTYPRQTQSVATILVPVLLVLRHDLDPALVRAVTEEARSSWALLSRELSSISPLSEPPSLAASGLPLVDWYSEPRVDRKKAEPIRFLLWMSLALLAGAVAVRGWQDIRQFVRGHPFAAGAVITTLFAFVAAVGAYVFEHQINENFSTLPESMWSITLYLLSGLEARVPYTAEGRAFSILAIVIGPVALAALTGYIASRIVIHFLGRAMPSNLTNHYVIVNWNHRTRAVIKELHNELITNRKGVVPIVVLADQPDLDKKSFEGSEPRDGTFEDVFFSVGDPAQEWSLRNVNAIDARAVVLLADDRVGEEADARTIRSAFALRRLAEEKGRTDLHLVVELVNLDNMPVLEDLANRFPGLLEVVGGSYLRTLALAQAALHPGLVGFYKELLSTSEDSNEVYLVEIPESAAGLSFNAYSAMILANERKQPLIPVGIQRGSTASSSIVCNPPASSPASTLERGDRLAVLAYTPPERDDLPTPVESR